MGCKIIFFTTFWCKTLNNGSLLNLSLILILDTNELINWRGVCKKHFFTIFGFLFLVRSNRCLPVVAGMSFFFFSFLLAGPISDKDLFIGIALLFWYKGSFFSDAGILLDELQFFVICSGFRIWFFDIRD